VRRRQLERLDEEAVSVLFGVVLLSLYRETSDVSLNSRTRRVCVIGGLGERCAGSLGGWVSICMGSGTRDRTQGRMSASKKAEGQDTVSGRVCTFRRRCPFFLRLFLCRCVLCRGSLFGLLLGRILRRGCLCGCSFRPGLSLSLHLL